MREKGTRGAGEAYRGLKGDRTQATKCEKPSNFWFAGFNCIETGLATHTRRYIGAAHAYSVVRSHVDRNRLFSYFNYVMPALLEGSQYSASQQQVPVRTCATGAVEC
jgi:hypothetical protein